MQKLSAPESALLSGAELDVELARRSALEKVPLSVYRLGLQRVPP